MLERPRLRSLGNSLIAGFLLLGLVTPSAAVELKWRMHHDPFLPKPPTEVRFPEGLVNLWLEALARPERDLNRRAASAIAVAHEKGVLGLEVTIDPLMQLLKATDDRTVRLTAARALAQLDDKRAADLLFDSLSEDDLELAEFVEPALARWDHPPIREHFLQRIQQEVTLRRRHILAIRGLAQLQEARAMPRLTELAQDVTVPPDLRLEAARALGQMHDRGLTETARKLSADKTARRAVDRLVAAHLLTRHKDEESLELLRELAEDTQSPVQAMALENLFRHDPASILPVANGLTSSKDAGVRKWAAQALIATPNLARLETLSSLLSDPHVEVRESVTDAMLTLAERDEFREAIIGHARTVLGGDDWRGQEQATALLVALDDKTIADRLLELLDSPRFEVLSIAAWGLSQLAVPATAGPMLATLDRRTQTALSRVPGSDRYYRQICHIAQALGHMNYSPARDTLGKYISKGNGLRVQTRAAAIWALGQMGREDPDPRLARQFRQRLTDIDSMSPEQLEVRTMAAVALGTMGATEAVDSLREMLRIDGARTSVGHACQWALHKLTGEPIPEPEPIVYWEEDWFLTPLK